MFIRLEKDVEADVTIYAEFKKCLHLKLTILGRVGWPDHIYLYHGAKILFIEFKRVGEKPRKIQVYIHGRLRSYGFRVEVVDSYEQGCRIIDQFTEARADV